VGTRTRRDPRPKGISVTASPPPVLPDDRLAVGIARLALRYRGRFPPETVQRLITDSHGRLAEHARVRTHLVVPAGHLATERLDALARIEGAPGSGLPRGLFVCSHNAGRSRTAANGRRAPRAPRRRPCGRLLRRYAPGRRGRAGRRAGTEGAGLDLTDAFPKPLTNEVVQAADIIVTMGYGDACPVIPGRRYLDWPVTDPEGAPLTASSAVSATRPTPTSPSCPPPRRAAEATSRTIC